MADPVFAKAMELYMAWLLAEGVAKEAAWATFVRFLAANPLVLEAVIGTFNAASASSAAFTASLRVAVQRAMQAAAARAGAELLAEQLVTTELRAGFLAQRVAQAFGKTPKVPISPQGQIAIALVIVLAASGQAVAETKSKQYYVPEYQAYLESYFIRVAKLSEIRPTALERINPPMDFDAWFIHNYGEQ